ncbi:hypothetical protein NJI34_43905, partial [Pseudomonas sp. S 311-6]|nr:hypothetical protein [Pseudomonas sp. S 311-6]
SLNNLLPPPPLPESEINNFFIWIAVGLQAIFTFFGNDFSIFHILCVVAILFILSLIDSCLLAKAGHKAPSAFWALWIFPVYVILRGIRIKTRRFYWYAEIFLLLALALALSIPLVTNSNSDIEEASCNLVTNILQNQLNQKTSCIYVSIDSNPQPNVYEATAVLSNTKEVKISIEQKDKPRRLLTVKIKGD